MLTTATPAGVQGTHVVAPRAPTLGWALRRTLLALIILVVSIGGAACLLYASIDPDEDTVPAAKSAPHVVPSNSSGHGPANPTSPTRV